MTNDTRYEETGARRTARQSVRLIVIMVLVAAGLWLYVQVTGDDEANRSASECLTDDALGTIQHTGRLAGITDQGALVVRGDGQDVVVRLCGARLPAADECGAKQAYAHATRALHGRKLRVKVQDSIPYSFGEPVSTVSAARSGKQDVGLMLLRAGWARPADDAPAAYQRAGQQAAERGRGLYRVCGGQPEGYLSTPVRAIGSRDV